MGMFDELICKHILPDNDLPDETVFQTKNLNCRLDRYEITKTGQLQLARIGKPGHHIKRKDRIPLDYNGFLYFYTEIVHGAQTGKRYDYVAKFTDCLVYEIITLGNR